MPEKNPDEGMDCRGRRRFLAAAGGLGLLWTLGAAYPAYRYLSPLPAADLFGKEGRAKVEKITPADVAAPGSGKNGGYSGRGLVLFRSPDGELRAFDARCTHAGCNVKFAGTVLSCPCHGGQYDLLGKNISGPPPKPLTRLNVIEEGDALYVSPMEPAKG